MSYKRFPKPADSFSPHSGKNDLLNIKPDAIFPPLATTRPPPLNTARSGTLCLLFPEQTELVQGK